MNLSEFSIHHPRLLAIIMLALLVWGGISLATLPRQEEPVLTWRLANVVTRLPGATPERVEALITDVLERRVREVDEVEHVYSVSRAGVSLLQVELSDDVTDAGPVWQKVRHELTQATAQLPPGVQGPDLDDEIMGTYTQLIAVTGERLIGELEEYAEALEDRLRYLPDTASTNTFGVQPETIEVRVDPNRLAAFDLSFAQIADVLQRRNVNRPSGRLPLAQREVLIEVSGEFQFEYEPREMVLLSTSEGSVVRLGDVSTITRTVRDPPEPLARHNGRAAVVVGVRARAGRRIDRFGDQVAAVVEVYNREVSPDVRCEIFHDLGYYTRERASSLGQTLLLSATFVFLTTALFMGWRGACIVTATIPLTGMIVFFLFSLFAIPLNEMSFMAIIMAFGLLVDDAIIVTEQIHHRSSGEEIAVVAAREPARLFVPLVVTTLTTVAAFLPIYLLPGGVGEFVRAIPVGVALCLLTALVVSMTFVPWLAVGLMQRRSAVAEPGWPARVGQSVMARYRWVLQGTVKRPVLALGLVIAALVPMATLGLALRRDFFSPVQRDQFVVDVFAPQGSSVDHTAEIVAGVEDRLAAIPHVASTASFIGRNAPLTFYNLQSQETYADHYAQLIVRVDDWRHTWQAAAQLQAELNEKIVEADCCVRILEHGAPLIAPFEVRISGPSVGTLRELGRRTSVILRETPGVRNVRDNYGNDSLKLVVNVNEPAARHIGIDQATVADELRHRLDGIAAGFLREGDDSIPIVLRLPEADRGDISNLKSIYFKPSPHAGLIPFSTVATLAPEWEPASIYRRDGARTLSVLGYPEFGLTAAQVADGFGKRLTQLQASLPGGYSLELGGENEQRNQAETHLLSNGVYALFLMLVFLVYEFRSLRLTLLILAVVPLSLGGVMVGLLVTGWPLNFMAIMGMMVLFGVVVNDAVVLLDGFESRRREGEAVQQLAVEGTLDRARHILMTTMTTVAGFLPLALSPSLLWPPLAIAIIGGIILSTVLALVALPAAYTLLFRTATSSSALDPFSKGSLN